MEDVAHLVVLARDEAAHEGRDARRRAVLPPAEPVAPTASQHRVRVRFQERRGTYTNQYQDLFALSTAVLVHSDSDASYEPKHVL